MLEFLAAMVNRKKLTNKQPVRLKDYLLEHLTNSMMPHGTFGDAAAEFSVTRQTVFRLWKGWRASHATALNGEWDVTSGKKGTDHCLKYYCDDVAQAVCECPLRSRSTVTVRLLEGALTISRGTIPRLIRTEKVLRSHSSVVKPILSDENKLHRVDFCPNERGNNGL
jgi:hypothetical protein